MKPRVFKALENEYDKEYEMKTKIVLLSLGMLVISACSTPPSQSELSTLPVVEFGQTVPDGGDYILYFPAGKDIPTDVVINGNLFQTTAQQVLTVKLKHDIYSYKQWVSFDNQHWLHARDALDFKLDVKIPGYKYPKPGHIRLHMSKTN
jgi:hypothetical protein